MRSTRINNFVMDQIQHLETEGKRMGSEFLGKKRSSPTLSEQPTLDAQYYLQKKMGSEFLGRRRWREWSFQHHHHHSPKKNQKIKHLKVISQQNNFPLKKMQ